MANVTAIPFQRKAIEPVQCLKAGWNLVKDQYWLFLGMCLVAWLIGSAVPMAILMGPMMCGLFLALFRLRRLQPVEFATLFKGFDYFGPSLVATLLHVLPIIAILIPAYLFLYVGLFVTIATQAGNDPNPWGLVALLGMFAIFLAVILLVMFISIGFMFVYPLIVEPGSGRA